MESCLCELLQIDSSAGSCSPVGEGVQTSVSFSFVHILLIDFYWLLIVPLFSLSIKNIFPYSLFIVVWFNITRKSVIRETSALVCLFVAFYVTLQTDLPLFVSPSVSSPPNAAASAFSGIIFLSASGTWELPGYACGNSAVPLLLVIPIYSHLSSLILKKCSVSLILVH